MAIYLRGLQLREGADKVILYLVTYLYFALKSFALALINSKARQYQTQTGNKRLQKQYADDLTIFLEYIDGEDDLNTLTLLGPASEHNIEDQGGLLGPPLERVRMT